MNVARRVHQGIDRQASHGEVAIAIMEKEYRGNGYGTEAMKLLLSYAFGTIGLATLYLTVFSRNNGAIRVYDNLDSVPEAFFRLLLRFPLAICAGNLRTNLTACFVVGTRERT